MDIISQVQVSGSIYDIGGGHIIVNESGTNLTRRASLQFNNATIVDDSTNNKTIVTIPEGLQLGTTSTTALKGDTKYAGSSSAGGAATSANKLNTDAGNTTTPVYFKNGIPKALGYTLAKSVPSDAKFTDTTYGAVTSSANGLAISTDKAKFDAMAFISYGTCTTAAGTREKVATLTNSNWSLKVGSLVGIKFTNNNTYNATASSQITLNVNNTGAKPIYGYGSATANTGTNTTLYGRANYINYYMYDGTYWVWAGSSGDNNTTYTPQALGFGYGTCSTASSTTAKAVTLNGYNLTNNGIVSIKFNNSVPANSTLNINSKGAKAIYHRGVALLSDVIRAGDTATFIYYDNKYHLISLDRSVYIWTAWAMITTHSQELYGKTITITKNGKTVGTTAFSNEGEALFELHEPGTYTFSVSTN